MRVIAGKYRSRVLTAPDGLGTRPTSDRLRETMFNILAARMELDGCRFADLYAGTGAVGIEAISRGAGHTWFGENGAPALLCLRKNLLALKVSGAEYTVEEKGVGALLGRFEKLGLGMDVVFVDPPYDAKDEYAATLTGLGRPGRMNAGGMVVVEFGTKAKFELAERYGGLERTRVYKQGESSLAFYGLGGKAEPV